MQVVQLKNNLEVRKKFCEISVRISSKSLDFSYEQNLLRKLLV
jgi:hypothetical protein